MFEAITSFLNSSEIKKVMSAKFVPDKRSGYLTRTKNTGTYGYVPNPTDTTAYLIKVTSTQVGSIRALMQDKFTLRTSADWQPFTGVGSNLAGLNEVTALAGTTVFNQFISRRIWNGTQPLSLSVPLKFIAKSNPLTEVLIPSIMLMQMALPSLPIKETLSGFHNGGVSEKIVNTINQFLLRPPGPNPLAQSFLANSLEAAVSDFNKAFDTQLAFNIPEGDLITIKIGNFTEFKSVIIKDVVVDFPKKMASNGMPIESSVQLEFETFEIQTKEDMISSFDAYIDSMVKEDTRQAEMQKKADVLNNYNPFG